MVHIEILSNISRERKKNQFYTETKNKKLRVRGEQET